MLVLEEGKPSSKSIWYTESFQRLTGKKAVIHTRRGSKQAWKSNQGHKLDPETGLAGSRPIS